MQSDTKWTMPTGQSWAASIGSMALETIFAALSATTAVAAGFLFAIGIDIVVLIGKWTIISAIVFYTGILWALISPILALPKTVDIAAATRVRTVEKEAGEKAAEKQLRIAAWQDELQTAVAAQVAARSAWMPQRWRKPAAVLAEKRAVRKVERLQASLSHVSHVTEGDSAPAAARLSRITRSLVGISYVAAVAILLVFALGPVGGGLIVVGLAVIALVWRLAGSIRVVYPLLSVLLLTFGYMLGKSILGLPPSARVTLDTGEISARILLTSDQDILLLQGHGAAAQPTLTLLPRTAVKRITIAPGRSLDGWPGSYLFKRWLF